MSRAGVSRLFGVGCGGGRARTAARIPSAEHPSAHLRVRSLQVLKEATDLELSLQLNIALVCIKREDYEGAAEAASAVLDRRPSDSKALYRRGLARLHLNLRRGACSDFRALLKAEPGMAHTVRRHLAEAYDLAKDDLHPDWADLFQRSRGRAPEGGASPGTQDSDEEDDAEDDAEDDDDDDEDARESRGRSRAMARLFRMGLLRCLASQQASWAQCSGARLRTRHGRQCRS